MSFREIAKECRISARSVQRSVKPRTPYQTPKNATKSRRGRPRKISPTLERYIIRELRKLRVLEGTFTLTRLMTVTGISPSVIPRRTLLDMLHRNGFRFRQTRKKGLLTVKDLKDRLRFAKKYIKRPASFWTDGVAFFLDAVAFVHKTNPLDQARAPKSRVYRQPSEGLTRGCTAKGMKEGSGGKYVRLVVAITHGKGVLISEPYEKMTGAYFADFIDTHFTRLFDAADKETNVFIQDGDPSQNSALAKEAMRRTNAQLLPIPPRSPDMNPIENIFNLCGSALRDDAIKHMITKETHDEFQERVIRTLNAIPQQTIDNVIASTKSRLQRVIEGRGQRTKY